MIRRMVSAGLALLFVAAVAVAADKEVTGKVVKVDTVKKVVIVQTADGKKEISTDDETKVVGPRGAARRDGLKDALLVEGAEVKLTLARDGQPAKEIKITKAAAAGAPTTPRRRAATEIKDGVKAKIVKVDVDKQTITVTIDGKRQELTVAEDAKFIGPQGGKATIKDDRVKAGAEVTIVLGKDKTTLKEVHLARRAPSSDAPKKGDRKDK
jgi:hypothetical protein